MKHRVRIIPYNLPIIPTIPYDPYHISLVGRGKGGCHTSPSFDSQTIIELNFIKSMYRSPITLRQHAILHELLTLYHFIKFIYG